MNILVPLAVGFEEIEAVTIVDVLRRAELEVATAALGTNPVEGAHGIKVTADRSLSGCRATDFDCIVLPGGMPGSENLRKSSEIISLVQDIRSQGGYVAAICAAPMVLGEAGVLEKTNATCFPGFEKFLHGARLSREPVIADGRVITGRGPGCAIPFSLKLVEIFRGFDISLQLKKDMQVYWM